MRLPSLCAIALTLAACDRATETAVAPVTPEATPAVSVQASASADPALLTFLQARTREAMGPLGYVARTTGEGVNALTLVYLVGPEYCGSGGCNLLILRRGASGYDVLGETTVTRAPSLARQSTLLRKTRLCVRSPTRTTCLSSRVPRRRVSV